MDSLFKNLQKKRHYEKAVKDGLLEALKVAVKKVQVYKELEENDVYVTSEDAGKELVMVLESIFIHGVRETISDRISSALGDPDRRPTPAFWSPMMIFTHPHIIAQVNSLSQIVNDVGRSRAWIRLCLNEGNFLGYLLSISQDMKTLKRYYKNGALLLDHDRLTTAIGYFQGVSQFRFSFPSNSSVFNYWSNQVLLTAGFWTPAMKESALPVSVELDVAQALEASAGPASDSDSVISSSSSLNHNLFANDEEILNQILKTPLNTPPVGSPLLDRLEASLPSLVDAAIAVAGKSSSPSKTEVDDDQNLPRGNPIDDLPDDSDPPEQPPPNPRRSSFVQKTIDDKYHEVLESYEQPSNLNSLVPESELHDFVKNYLPAPEGVPEQKQTLESPGSSAVKDFKHLVEMTISGKILQQPGLDSQGFCCKDCRQVIGVSSFKAMVCAMSGSYYCEDCFKSFKCVIAPRVIRNWDFALYPVSPHSHEFISGTSKHPLINIRSTNPRLYLVFEKMGDVHKLRLKLNLLRPFLLTCNDSAKDRLSTLLWPREYLFEHVHLYSLDDLIEVERGQLSVLLNKAIRLGEDHVRSCTLCSQKGFLCELCRTPNNCSATIFPFDIENVHKCPRCRTIFHIECMKKAEDVCPKCSRIALRKLQLERNLSEET